MVDEWIEQAGPGRQRQLEHHPGHRRAWHPAPSGSLPTGIWSALRPFRALDVSPRARWIGIRPAGEDLLADFVTAASPPPRFPPELARFDDRALLGAEHAEPFGAWPSSASRSGNRASSAARRSFSPSKPLSILMNGTTAAALSARPGHRLAAGLPVHRALEQDRAEHLVAGWKAGEVMMRHTHLVDQPEHLLVIWRRRRPRWP